MLFPSPHKMSVTLLERLNNGAVCITSWYSKVKWSHFGLPPSSIYRMTGLGGNHDIHTCYILTLTRITVHSFLLSAATRLPLLASIWHPLPWTCFEPALCVNTFMLPWQRTNNPASMTSMRFTVRLVHTLDTHVSLRFLLLLLLLSSSSFCLIIYLSLYTSLWCVLFLVQVTFSTTSTSFGRTRSQRTSWRSAGSERNSVKFFASGWVARTRLPCVFRATEHHTHLTTVCLSFQKWLKRTLEVLCTSSLANHCSENKKLSESHTSSVTSKF